jgi:peptidoglycan/LPS O-acetylase OafA/YrhL
MIPAGRGGADARFPALDGLRAIAAFLVVCTHVGFITGRNFDDDVLGPILSRGDFGVALFFLLSGFLLYRPFAAHALGLRPHPDVRRFLWRRFLRIGPAMIVFVVITLTWVTQYRVRAADYVHYLLLIQTYDHHDYDPNLAQLWTLSIEVCFYLALPIIARLGWTRDERPMSAAYRSREVLIIFFLIAPVFTIVQLHLLRGTQALLWIPAYTDWFALGMWLAMLSCVPETSRIFVSARRRLGAWASAPGTCWGIAALCYLISTLPVGNPRTLAPALYWQWTAQHYLYGAAAFFLMLPLVLGHHPNIERVLGSKFAGFLGNISYGVYLWHVPLMSKIQSALDYKEFDGHFVPTLLAVTAVATAVATASWFLVERPLLRRYSSASWRALQPSTVKDSAATHSS